MSQLFPEQPKLATHYTIFLYRFPLALPKPYEIKPKHFQIVMRIRHNMVQGKSKRKKLNKIGVSSFSVWQK